MGADFSNWLLKPLLVGLLVLVGLGLFSVDPARGDGAGFDCYAFTGNAELNRTICKYNPARLWNMPVSDLVPDLRGWF